MKNLLSILAILGLVAFSSCEKSKENEAAIGKTVKVKVIKEICGQAALQIVDPAFYDLGSTVVIDNISYDHVFITQFACSERNLISDCINEGRAFNVNIVAEPKQETDCVNCAATLNFTSKGAWRVYHVRIANNCMVTTMPVILPG